MKKPRTDSVRFRTGQPVVVGETAWRPPTPVKSVSSLTFNAVDTAALSIGTLWHFPQEPRRPFGIYN